MNYNNNRPQQNYNPASFNQPQTQQNPGWNTTPGMNGQILNQKTQLAMQKEYLDNFFNYFMFEHQTAPISSGIKGVKNSPLVSFIYKWDFLEKRYRCLKENELLMSGRVDRFELLQFLQNLHSLKVVNPKNKEKTKLGIGFAFILLLFLAAIALFFFVFGSDNSNDGFFTMNRIITGGVATGILLPLMIFFLVRILTSDKRHSRKLGERKKAIEQFLQRINMAISSRGLRWKLSPYGSWLVLSLGFKKGVNGKLVKGILSKRAKENMEKSRYGGLRSQRSFNNGGGSNRSRVLREKDINIDVMQKSSSKGTISRKGDKPPTFQNTLKNSEASKGPESKKSLEFRHKNKKLTSNLKFQDNKVVKTKLEKKKSLGELGLFNKDPYASVSNSSESSEEKSPKKNFKKRNLMKESSYYDEESSEYRISRSRKKNKKNKFSASNSKYEAELPEVLVMDKSSTKKPRREEYESRRQVMPWDDIDSENNFDKANRGQRRSFERSSVKISSQPNYEMLEIRDPGRKKKTRMGRFLMDEVSKEMRNTHDFNVYGEKFSPNEANRSYLKSGKKQRDSSGRRRRGLPW